MASVAEPLPVRPEQAAYARALAPFLRAMDELQNETIRLEVYRALSAGEAPRVGGVPRAIERLADAVRSSQQSADMSARLDVVKSADRFARQGLARAAPAAAAAELPSVPYTEAIADILAREPRLARGAAEVSRAYSSEHALSIARAASVKTTERVQKALAKAMATRQTAEGTIKSIRGIAAAMGEDMADWTHAYAETVMRTNMGTAYSAGKFRQMADPAVAYAIGALRFDGPTDIPPAGDARPNHAAAVGLIGAANDPGWARIAPPLGYG